MPKRKQIFAILSMVANYLTELKNNRKELSSHIQVKDLPPDQQFKVLSVESKYLVDTIKMIVYRSECALVETVREYLSDSEDARILIKRNLLQMQN